MLVSHKGAASAWQHRRLTQLEAVAARARPRAAVDVCIADACDERELEALVAPQDLRGVWHLALLLQDGLFASETSEKWTAVQRVKVDCFASLDRLTDFSERIIHLNLGRNDL